MEAEKIRIQIEGNRFIIGTSPQLVVNLDSQENYIVADGKRRAYFREVALSRDLLEGKRRNALDTAVRYYYGQACRVLDGMIAAEAYRNKALESAVPKPMTPDFEWEQESYGKSILS